MCFANKCRGDRCQRCIKVAVFILAGFLLLQFIMGILKFVFTTGIGKQEVFKVVMGVAFDGGAMAEINTFLTMVGTILMLVTFAGVICGCCSIFCAKKCNDKMKGCMTGCTVTFSFLIYLTTAILWFILGAIFLIPSQLGPQFVEDNCKYAIAGETEKMNMGGVDVSGLFTTLNDFDGVYASAINTWMCSDFCICPGIQTDEHYMKYAQVPEAQYAKYDRTFNKGFTGEINLDISRSEPKPLFFNLIKDPTTGKKYYDADIESASMIECFENTVNVIDAYTRQQVTKIQEKRAENGLAPLSANDLNAQVNSNKGKFTSLSAKVSSSKPDDKFMKVVKYMEKEYSCSGFCTPALFYLTESVKKGPPVKGCFKPFMEDIGGLLAELGSTLVAAAVFFLIMIFFLCPMCCHKPPEEGPTKVQTLEGGSLQLAALEGGDQSEDVPINVVKRDEF